MASSQNPDTRCRLDSSSLKRQCPGSFIREEASVGGMMSRLPGQPGFHPAEPSRHGIEYASDLSYLRGKEDVYVYTFTTSCRDLGEGCSQGFNFPDCPVCGLRTL